MVHVHCEAEVKVEEQRKSLCRCITIIGSKPIVNGDIVSVDYEGSRPDKIIALFDRFPVHNITVKNK